MFQFQGLIDFSRLGRPSGPLPVAMQGDVACLSLPGLEVKWHCQRANMAQRDGCLALAIGRPRGLPGAQAGPAAAWLEQYANRGGQAAEEISGGFATVLIDLDARTAHLFIDRFAIETLCYRASANTLAFANTAADVPGSGTAIDPQSIYDYLYFHVIPAPNTIFTGIRRLQAAHVVTVSSTGAVERAYWKPTFVESDRGELRGRMRRFVEIVRDSVAEDADEPGTACFLSGGTDSSTIAGMLTQLRGQPAHAYSIGFESEGYDEMAYARIAASHFGLAHHEYYLTPEDLIQAIPKLAASMDQPFGNSSVLPAYYCALRAHEDGFTRMLAGDGGDELYGGNSRYATQKLFDIYHRLPASLRECILEPAATRWPLFTRAPGFRKLGGFVRHARKPMPDRLEAFNLLHQIGEDAIFEPAFRATVNPQRPLLQQRTAWRSVDDTSLTNRMLAYDWKFTLADSDLPKVRSAAELAGVSVGYPFLSRAVTDFSLTLPPEWKLKRLRLRWFFKEALREFLPAAILRKKKHGFGLPFGPWVLRNPRLREFVVDSVEGAARRGVVREPFTRDLMSRHLAEAPGYYGEMVWLLMMLEQWMRSREIAVISDA